MRLFPRPEAPNMGHELLTGSKHAPISCPCHIKSVAGVIERYAGYAAAFQIEDGGGKKPIVRGRGADHQFPGSVHGVPAERERTGADVAWEGNPPLRSVSDRNSKEMHCFIKVIR